MSPPALPTPPFDRDAARRLREQLGMGPEHVARTMRASYGVDVPPETITDWERGQHSPTGPELQALAGALWCGPDDLLRAPSTLLEHRWVRGLTSADLARLAGIPPKDYDRLERRNRWTGSAAQTAALGAALGLSPPELLLLTGHREA
ncbi:helix-turn-helix domain-containing protein [Streptomyces sp. NBC_01262]|uniref:helix-turn-helix domain-containing protein n=1 Tax=Streptomyces sp. NBC_01262 TaxID=2903803 RepID=UPI002E2F1EA8|nr:helix-turn-helix transcriptional regulator [Streptomyces sp. NBC_01262]